MPIKTEPFKFWLVNVIMKLFKNELKFLI